ncbi:MAG: OmpA family protein [Flavobacteriaceae bacterium]
MRPILKLTLSLAILFCYSTANAQIWKKLQKKAENAVEKKLENKVENETKKTMDSILDPNQKPTNNTLENNDDNRIVSIPTNNQPQSSKLEVYRKFDFVPGDKLIFFDNYSQDFIGDFPSKWNTNGSGEVVKINKSSNKWLQLKSGHGITYIPLIANKLSDDYTIEFDLFTVGLEQNTSSNAKLYVTLDDNNGFTNGRDYAYTAIPFGQYRAFGLIVKNTNHGNLKVNTTVSADIRKPVLNTPHISIAVNKTRFRCWVNETKYIDIPQFIYKPEKIGFLKFNLHGLPDEKGNIFIGNLKIAEGGVDLRRKLMTEGRVSTNGILFDSGKAIIKPQSYGIIRQVSQVLQQEPSMKLNIIGHTDSDGNAAANLELSKERAEAVKKALNTIYNIPINRLQTQGKGANSPIADNNTSAGKAQNRRVEFIKVN